MFNMNEFLMKTLKGMIGNYPDFQVREFALNWYAKGKLTEEDLATIDDLIETQYIVPEPPVEEPIEDIPTDETYENTENEDYTDYTEEPVEDTY